MLVNKKAVIICIILSLFCVIGARPEETKFTYDSQGKRNPFIPLVTPDGRLLKLDQQKSAGGLFLEGIIYDKNGLSYAMVNDQVVKIGDTVGDYQVLRIEEKKVVFIKEGEPKEVELKEEE